ncbi:MAG: hypothetical protein DME26_07355 [Verrucomicrobia bacterium]|nr:MAG: hypothetical protein DME26_07355 [Verrucomicrobiota bacterium]
MKTKQSFVIAVIVVIASIRSSGQTNQTNSSLSPANTAGQLSDGHAILEWQRTRVRELSPLAAEKQQLLEKLEQAMRARVPTRPVIPPVVSVDPVQKAAVEQVQRDEIVRLQILNQERRELTRQIGATSDPAQRQALRALLDQKYEAWRARSRAEYERVYPKAQPLSSGSALGPQTNDVGVASTPKASAPQP